MDLTAALLDAVRAGDAARLSTLLRERPGLVRAADQHGKTALQWAAFNGHPRVVELLLARRANPDLRDSRFDADAAGWAHEGGHGNIMAMLRAG